MAAKRRKKRRAPTNAHHVCLDDVAPRIGSGWRIVELLSLGPKWARIREINTSRGTRVPRNVWAQLVRRERSHIEWRGLARTRER
jgi:hypothetical protein